MNNKPKNNFDFLRMLAATLVMVSHAYQLSYGEKIWDQSLNLPHPEPLLWLSRGQLSIGHLSVLIFFVISGYLITMSQERSPNPWFFLKSRCLRILPGLAVVIIVSIFLLGPLGSTLPLSEYFQNFDTWKYLINITMYFSAETLPGVFASNPLPSIVNGSLWTLKYEFSCYLVVCGLAIFGLLNRKVSLALFALSFAEVLFARHTGHPFVYFLMFFTAGSVLYLYRSFIVLRGRLALIGIAILLLSAIYGSIFSNKTFILAFAIFGSYLILYLAFVPWLKLHSFSRYGDFSYGLYIYAFPIQQLVTHVSPAKLEWYSNFLMAFPLSLGCAYLSWHWIEKKALAMKGSRRQVIQTAG